MPPCFLVIAFGGSCRATGRPNKATARKMAADGERADPDAELDWPSSAEGYELLENIGEVSCRRSPSQRRHRTPSCRLSRLRWIVGPHAARHISFRSVGCRGRRNGGSRRRRQHAAHLPPFVALTRSRRRIAPVPRDRRWAEIGALPLFRGIGPPAACWRALGTGRHLPTARAVACPRAHVLFVA